MTSEGLTLPLFWQRLAVLLGMATERHDSELKMLERCHAQSWKDNISQMTTSQIITQNVHCFETALVTTAAQVAHCCTRIKKKERKNTLQPSFLRKIQKPSSFIQKRSHLASMGCETLCVMRHSLLHKKCYSKHLTAHHLAVCVNILSVSINHIWSEDENIFHMSLFCLQWTQRKQQENKPEMLRQSKVSHFGLL